MPEGIINQDGQPLRAQAIGEMLAKSEGFMKWPFKGKRALKSDSPKLIFKSGEAFFQSQCKFGVTEIKEKQGIIALVLDPRKEKGSDTPVQLGPDGRQYALLKVVSGDGGFDVIAGTRSANGDRLKPGDLVMWAPYKHVPELAEKHGDHRKGWIGFIIAKIAPELDPAVNEFAVICRY